MGHTKVFSQGNIPFSWEDRPGISKVLNHSKCPNEGLYALDLSTLKSSLPPPPCLLSRRSSSRTVLARRPEDPFVAAYKECTRNEREDQRKLVTGGKTPASKSVRKSGRSIFSCKSSCEVRDDALVKVRMVKLPPYS